MATYILPATPHFIDHRTVSEYGLDVHPNMGSGHHHKVELQVGTARAILTYEQSGKLIKALQQARDGQSRYKKEWKAQKAKSAKSAKTAQK